MKKKTKVLIANDSHYLGTGYGVYGKELLTRLHNSGKYEVAEIGCYSDGTTEDAKKCRWKFFPAIPEKSNEQLIKEYGKNTINQFGAFVFSHVLSDFQPDIVFDIRDYWMYAFQETHTFRPFYKWVVMPTVDSAPQKEDWLYTFANMDVVVPYTQWAKDTLIKQCGEQINLFPKIANAGINPDVFKPIMNKKDYQKTIFGKSVYITGLVMRNQKRKLIPDLFKAYKLFLSSLSDKEYDKHYLYLHTSYPEANGWDIPKLLLEHNLLDKVYFTYTCRNCKEIYPSKFQNNVCKCKNCGNDSTIMPNASNPVTTEQLNSIYNMFDFFIQYAICEGFGMPQIEAASCGVPIASVDYSAMSEIVENLNGFKIPIKRLFRELETDADRAYPDIDATVKILHHFYNELDQSDRNKLSHKTRKLCSEIYTWDNVYKVWDECFSSVDLSTKLDWKCKPRATGHQNLSVPQNLSKKQFVEFVINEIIKEPYLLKTAPIISIMRDFNNDIFAASGSTIRSYNYQDVIKILEAHLNNKVVHENMRQKTNARPI